MAPQDEQADSPSGLHEALRLHKQGQLDQAALRYEAAIETQLENFDAMHLVGVLRYQQGRHAEALVRIQAALQWKPASAEALSNLGLVYDALGRHEEALTTYERALAIRPGYADALNNRGVALRALKRPMEALACFEQALAAQPDNADALNNRGVALHDLGRSAEALDSLGKALRVRTDYREAQRNHDSVRQVHGRPNHASSGRADALNNRGNALRRLKRPREALACYDAALAIRPDFPEAFSNRGNALLDLKRPVAALKSYDRALAIRSSYADALSNRGVALLDLQRPVEALASYRKALAVNPRFSDALSNRGVALRDLGRLEEALQSLDEALAIRPDHADALNNRGLLLHDLGRPEEALASYDNALAVRPRYADARFNRALTALSVGDFASGWRGYEFRWNRKNAAARKLCAPYPVWKGEDIVGKRLIVYEEQGLGDVIHFSRLLRSLVALGAEVTFLLRASLHSLLSVVAPTVRLVADPPKDGVFDYQCALMSLPGVLAISHESIPSSVPYLRAEAGAVVLWRQRLGERGLKIGVCWQGNPRTLANVGRSFPLRLLEGVASIPGVRLISVQKAHGLDQIESVPSGMNVETLGHEFDRDQNAFVHTAAVMSCLDLVITCDTSVAHLAGALGRPTWVALRCVPDWRWMLVRSDSPWYPTMKLYRQAVRGDWDAVFEQIAADVGHLKSDGNRL
jgi:tetratricopeptide (TPR) repeat protein